jgi:hypothetical protein
MSISNKHGKIQYYFKGIEMGVYKAILVNDDGKTATVRVPQENVTLKFLKIDNDWLLEGHTTSNSLLTGTKFVLN